MNGTDLLLSVVAGAMIVVSGGLYALLLALGRLRQSQSLGRLAAAAYLALVTFTVMLAYGLALASAWYPVIAVMLAGYWLAPQAIWHLTAATHDEAPDSPATARRDPAGS